MSSISHECTKRDCWYCYEINRLKKLKQPPEKQKIQKSIKEYKHLLKSA